MELNVPSNEIELSHMSFLQQEVWQTLSNLVATVEAVKMFD